MKNTKTYKVCLILMISINCFMLMTCNRVGKEEDKREVIWTDLRENKTYVKIDRGYSKSLDTKSIDFRLIANLTKHIYVPNGYSVTFGTQSEYTCVWDFSGPFTDKTKKIEFFLFDPVNYKEYDTYFEVKEVEGVLAYTITTSEKKTGKVYEIYSKDNIIDKVDFIASEGNIEGILKILEEKDFAIYSRFTNDDKSYSVPYNGYLIKSKMNGEYMELDTTMTQLSYWFY